MIKIKSIYKRRIRFVFVSGANKIKNPPEEWRKSAKYVGLIPRFRRIFLGDKEFNKNVMLNILKMLWKIKFVQLVTVNV